ncbi:MAG: PfkB family carbohydrate kinase [Patescibacteria group bacterium]
MKKILVVGSIAYDHILDFDGIFSESVNPSFTVHGRRTFFGGCAGNIAYHLRKLGCEPIIIGMAGNDFENYEKWMHKNKIKTTYLIRSEKEPTSAAFVVNDSNKKQLTLFDVGAACTFSSANEKELHSIIRSNDEKLSMAIISPTNTTLMQKAVAECQSFGIPYILDPGQVVSLFSSKQLMQMLKGSFALIANEDEMAIFRRISGLKTISNILKHTSLCIETKGEKGSQISTSAFSIPIPAVKSRTVVDPTGCGDAYRAGFMQVMVSAMGSNSQLSKSALRKGGLLGARLAKNIVESHGTQVTV